MAVHTGTDVSRSILLVVISLSSLGCYRSHERSRTEPEPPPDAGDAPDAAACTDPTDPDLLRRYRGLRCDPEVFDFPAAALDLAPGPCPGGLLATPFVSAGVWPNLGGGPRVRDACIRVVSASEASGVIPGSIIDSWVTDFAVPFDAADVELEMIGIERGCERLVYGRRRVRSTDFEGPRRLVESAEPILALADRSSSNWVSYATASAVFVREGEAISADHARDIIPGLARGRIAWLEGSDPTVMRIGGGSSEWAEPVAPDARLVRVLDADEDQLVLVEPGRARLFDVSDEVREVRSIELPAGASNPIVYHRVLAADVGGAIRAWALDTGTEIVDHGLEPGDRLLPTLPAPFAMRGWVLHRLLHEDGFRAMPFRDDDVELDPVTREAIGPFLTAAPMGTDYPLIVVGERGVGVVQGTRAEAAATVPRVFDAMEHLGGAIRIARTVWQFEIAVVVDVPDGSVLYEMRYEGSGWGYPCEIWE